MNTQNELNSRVNLVCTPESAALEASAQAGFSLVEMLIVMALMALAGTFVTTKLIDRFREGKVSATKTQMHQLGTILDDFRRVCGYYPTTDQGLDALVKAPQGRECKQYPQDAFLNKVPNDGFDNPFTYESDGNKYVIKSLGADGKAGGTGADSDISSDDPNF
jgi:general secretion pathway protein G